MSLSSKQLAAFLGVTREGSFSLAAQRLHITQSALSQRVRQLEEELETGLIIRDAAGLQLTPAGEELLRYCQVRESLETEALSRISSTQSSSGGTIRIGGFSSVM